MNIEQAQHIPIITFLSYIGIFPQRVRNGAAFYLSPLRKEKTASFKVDLNKNLWIDFGTGEGGNIIDLCMHINHTNVSQALKILSRMFNDSNFNPFSASKNNKNTGIKILSKRKINNHLLYKYLSERKINKEIAEKYLSEISFSIAGKKYFALGFMNDKGGYELRNKLFKGSSSPKYLTTIKKQSPALNIFEGVFDFLSALIYYKIKEPNNTTIILNSVIFIDKILDSLNNYSRINLYLDNDNTGIKFTEKIKQNHDRVFDYAKTIYPNHKDFNDFLISLTVKPPPKPPPEN